jgi:hypothetical protein
MKRLSWPGVAVVAGSTILSWLNTSHIVPPIAHTRAAIGSATTTNAATATSAVSASDSISAMRLHDWGPPTSAPGRTERDIFAFKRRPAKPAPATAPAHELFKGDGTQAPVVLFKLIGFAEDAGPDGEVRTAIISGQGQVYLVKEGETVAWIYRVGKILPDAVELLDSTGGPNLRLVLK